MNGTDMNVNDVMLNLELNVGEVNMILASLGKHPFDEVVALVSKIKQQGEAQIQELQAKQPPVE